MGGPGRGEEGQQPVGDEPRPTRTLRPLPKGLRPRGAQEPTPAEADEPGAGALAEAGDAGGEEAGGAEVAAEAPSGESKAD